MNSFEKIEAEKLACQIKKDGLKDIFLNAGTKEKDAIIVSYLICNLEIRREVKQSRLESDEFKSDFRAIVLSQLKEASQAEESNKKIELIKGYEIVLSKKTSHGFGFNVYSHEMILCGYDYPYISGYSFANGDTHLWIGNVQKPGFIWLHGEDGLDKHTEVMSAISLFIKTLKEVS